MSARPTHETASALHRRAKCPGSARMEKGMPDNSTADSRRGDDIHFALAHRKPDNTLDTEHGSYADLTDDEQTCVNILAAREVKLVAQLSVKHGEPKRVQREQRFYIYRAGDCADGEPVFSAQLDVVYEWDNGYAAIFDYKSGFGDVDDSSGNYQILSQVACLAHGIGWNMIYAAIIQPSEEPELVGYTMPQQEAAEKEVIRLIKETEKDDAPLNPGDSQCAYCKAKLICPALAEKSLSLAKKPVSEPEFEIMQPGALSETLERCAMAERYIDAIRGEARRRLTNGDSVPGWELADGAQVRVITDAQKALEALTPHGVTVEQVLSCVKIQVGELEKVTKSAAGWKGAAAKENFNNALESAGCLEFKKNAPSLKRTKQEPT